LVFIYILTNLNTVNSFLRGTIAHDCGPEHYIEILSRSKHTRFAEGERFWNKTPIANTVNYHNKEAGQSFFIPGPHQCF
jgi:hypothetical protein